MEWATSAASRRRSRRSEHRGPRSRQIPSKRVRQASKVILPGGGGVSVRDGRVAPDRAGRRFCEAVQEGKLCLGVCLGCSSLFRTQHGRRRAHRTRPVPGHVVRFRRSPRLEDPTHRLEHASVRRPARTAWTKSVPSVGYFVQTLITRARRTQRTWLPRPTIPTPSPAVVGAIISQHVSSIPRRAKRSGWPCMPILWPRVESTWVRRSAHSSAAHSMFLRGAIHPVNSQKERLRRVEEGERIVDRHDAQGPHRPAAARQSNLGSTPGRAAPGLKKWTRCFHLELCQNSPNGEVSMSTSLLYHAFGIRGSKYSRTDTTTPKVNFTVHQVKRVAS